jgi:tetratricopeptide (TPR) repeat protein
VQELAAASPGDLNLSNWQGNLGLLTADDLFEIGKVAEAVPLYQESTRTFEKLAGQSNNVRYLDALSMAYQRMGDMQLVDGHFAQAIPYYRKQMQVSKRLVAGDPKSLSFRNNVAASYATYGHALWRSGRVPEGLASLRRGLKEIADSGLRNSKAKGLEIILRFWLGGGQERGGDIGGALDNYLYVRDAYVDICASDPKDLSDCLMVAGLQDRIARMYIQKGRLDEARAEYQKAQTYCESLSGGREPNLEALYTVVNIYYGLGEISLSQARRTATPERKIQFWHEALHWYEQSHAAQSRIPGWLPITPNELDARTSKEIGARLWLCQSSLGHSVESATAPRS